MLAVRLPAVGEPLLLADVPIPEPRGTEVRIRVAGCGVCHTDLHILRGEQPRIATPLTLGHEVSGWVDAWGPAAGELLASELRAGEAVVVFGGWGCGACRECRAGEEQRCARGESPGFQRDGGYAEYLLVPHPRYLVWLGMLDPVQAAPLADAGVTPFRAVRRAADWLRPGARVLLIGFGGLGQFAIQYLARRPGILVAVEEIDPRKIELAHLAGALDELDGPPDVVFDFVGTDVTLARAAAAVTPGGLVSLVGEGGGGLRFGFQQPAVEAHLATTAWGSLDDLRAVVAMAPELSWNVERVPLRDAAQALQRIATGDVLGRLVLVPPD